MTMCMTATGLGCALPVRGVALRQQQKVRAGVQMRKQQRSSKMAVVCQASEERTQLEDKLLTQHAAMLSNAAVMGGGMWGLWPTAAALAEEAASEPSILGLTPTGAALTFAPVLLYAAFTLVRTSGLVPNLKISDFFFFIFSIAIFANLGALIFFKFRIF
uniref:Uncharacterized protein n=1 Tax=Pyramimonas obovata TaxID=1411642 RepID=A0A7S0QZ67_9CHLO|mmetsp:Transcript_22188/g.48710  ORF Transcript_22188/g.48710 Transcript_22188/m.48710 type:complete len:160 (+) Transcript_22188:78-557(+)|eukprot:CAMPEP_0118931998 /NCGR_PEP_ID=MMETSP1169-20130426/8932_1 /TAXON_ID=36882 /ORGANISM="Pyramimonas obovata, Strain CCMP722" /LENGTH=159 /DNA_ID=CAMNT_0006874583 /DNA_START=72 /DNA_END=551 /DNA_ORIENTATION=-